MKKLELLQWIYVVVLIIMVANFIRDIIRNRYDLLHYFGFFIVVLSLLLYKSLKIIRFLNMHKVLITNYL